MFSAFDLSGRSLYFALYVHRMHLWIYFVFRDVGVIMIAGQIHHGGEGHPIVNMMYL